jgi:ribosome-associated translation inhibitor RaiA
MASMGTGEYKHGDLAAIQNSIDALDKEINRLQTKLSNFINREA